MNRDREQYESILSGFVGQICHCTIACNSIKLRFGSSLQAHDRGYLWLDPPWSLLHHQQPLTDSAACPDYQEAEYPAKFQEWCQLIFPLDQTRLETCEFSLNQDLNLFFSDSYHLFLPAIAEPLENLELWYSHWYAKPIKP